MKYHVLIFLTVAIFSSCANSASYTKSETYPKVKNNTPRVYSLKKLENGKIEIKVNFPGEISNSPDLKINFLMMNATYSFFNKSIDSVVYKKGNSYITILTDNPTLYVKIKDGEFYKISLGKIKK